jgi:hypothetical protein
MASKFTEFLQSNKIDPRRVLSASRKLERLRPQDRALRLARRLKPPSADGEKKAEAAAEKPRAGRRVTRQLIARAEGGKAISGPAKTRLLRAVNQVLEQKKKDPVDLRALF